MRRSVLGTQRHRLVGSGILGPSNRNSHSYGKPLGLMSRRASTLGEVHINAGVTEMHVRWFNIAPLMLTSSTRSPL